MIDLHLHLDGSLSVEDFQFLASLKGVDLGKDFPNNIYVHKDCKSLEEYLQKFDLPLSLMQDEFSIAYVMKSLINRLYAMGYIYAEIRFAPQLHTREGMSQNNAVLAAITGLKSALKDKPDFDANIILCCMRQSSIITNMATIKLAEKYRSSKVVAVDLAGPEAVHTGDYYKKLFDEAYKRKVNITIHAGEACGSDEVMRAINILHAQRIGHGVHLDITKENVDQIIKNKVAFEFCPSSNLQTTSLSKYEDVPLSDFLRYGINVTINSDNMTVSNTNIVYEFKHLVRHFPLQWFEIKHLLNNSADAAFIPLEQKLELKKKIEAKFDDFYKEIIEKK